MRWLVTAGGTAAPIDRVRCITNSFTGRTGARIALEAHRRGTRVTLLTSHPTSAAEVAGGMLPLDANWQLREYRTFDELHREMEQQLRSGDFEAVVHSAAVSDYVSAGVYAPADGTTFDAHALTWSAINSPTLVDRGAAKVKSDEPELWLRLVKAPKLVDLARRDWGFRGTLVKFKLEVGVDDGRLLDIAERSRLHSSADLMVANTLDGSGQYAFLGPLAGAYRRVTRDELPAQLCDAIAAHRNEANRG